MNREGDTNRREKQGDKMKWGEKRNRERRRQKGKCGKGGKRRGVETKGDEK